MRSTAYCRASVLLVASLAARDVLHQLQQGGAVLDALFERGVRLLEGRFGPFALGDVAGNLRGADDSACTIPDGRDRQRDVAPGAILVHTLGLVMVEAFPTLEAHEDSGKSSDKSGGIRRESGLPRTSAAVYP